MFAFSFGNMGAALPHWRNSELGTILSGVVAQVCPEWVWPMGMRTLCCVEGSYKCQRQLGPGSSVRHRNSFPLAGLAQKKHLFLSPFWMPLNSNPAMPASNSKNTQGDSVVVGLCPCDSLNLGFPGPAAAWSPNVEIEYGAICCFGRKLWVFSLECLSPGPIQLTHLPGNQNK